MKMNSRTPDDRASITPGSAKMRKHIKPYLADDDPSEYIEFETPEEVFIWCDELQGQMSDGQYENSNINWEFWCNLPIVLGNKTKVHSNQHIMMNVEIDFTEDDWLFDKGHAYRGDEARATFSNIDDEELNEYLQRISDAMNDFAEVDEDYDPYKEDDC